MYCDENIVKKEHSCGNSCGHASTSRGVSHLRDGCVNSASFAESSCSGCSRCTESFCLVDANSRPFFIADSKDRLQKSKWDVIKDCFKRYVKSKRNECGMINSKNVDDVCRKDNKVYINLRLKSSPINVKK